MISDTGKQLYRALFLQARDAARRFVPRRAKVRAGGIGWSPIVLRWKRRGKSFTRVIVRRAAAATKVLSFPQFHFHFANYQTHRSSTNILRPATSSTRIFNTEIIRDKPRATTPVLATSLQPALDYRQAPRNNRESQSSAKVRNSATSLLKASKPATAYAIGSLLHPRKHLLSRPAISSIRPFTTKDEPALPLTAKSQVLQHWLVPIAARMRNQMNTPSRGHENKILQPQHSRTEELVWRRVSKTTTDITERVRHQEVFDSSEPRSQSVANQQTAVDVARAMDAAAIPITKLDPALMDRLADNVIRRVEQRVRIERERRGL